MASLKVTIQPFDIPEEVLVNVPGAADDVYVPITELDEETLGAMVEEFAAAVMAKASK